MGCMEICDKFGWEYHEPQDFVLSQWQKDRKRVGIVFCAYRIVMFAFVLSNFVANLIVTYGSILPYFFIYLTNHGLTLILAEQSVGLSLVLYSHFKQGKDGGEAYDIAKYVPLFGTVLAIPITEFAITRSNGILIENTWEAL